MDTFPKENTFDDLLSQLLQEKETYNYAEDYVKKIEQNFRELPEEQIQRNQEKKDITERIKKLQNQLYKTKNVKNIRRSEINISQSIKRRNIKKEIESLKDKLEVIKLEESK